MLYQYLLICCIPEMFHCLYESIPYTYESIPYMYESIPYMYENIPYMYESIPYMYESISYMYESSRYLYRDIRNSYGNRWIFSRPVSRACGTIYKGIKSRPCTTGRLHYACISEPVAGQGLPYMYAYN
ncbi:MAG: hypothetical protein LBG31_04415 [Prevotellaceae bacterium]|nr:hypothetical protein [Prevotellaceae bacterium]